MTTPTQAESMIFVRGIDKGHVSRLLQLSLRGPERPVDRLIARLHLPDAGAWLSRSLAALPAGNTDKAGSESLKLSAAELLLQSPNPGSAAAAAHLAALKSLKNSCKRQAAAEPGAEPLEALLGYFLAIGAALAHHHTAISSMPRTEIDPVLLDLAAALPDPWADMLCKATLSTT